MAKFVLVDHSLASTSDRHYDSANQVLRAAAQRGFETVLACNRRFQQRDEIPAECQVFPLFRHKADNPLSALHESRVVRGQERRARRFARGCAKLFRRIGLNAEDQVFLPTVSESDLRGLARFLKSEPSTRGADWHLQFHLEIFAGREPEYAAQQERLKRVRVCFQQALKEIPGHRLHFYTTSAPLADQYNRLGVALFDELTCPINAAFCRPSQRPSNAAPLRVICAGAVREEKGSQHFNDLVRGLWDDQLSNGRMQLSVQSQRRRFGNKPRLKIALPEKLRGSDQQDSDSGQFDPIVDVPHPLDPPAYVEFIRGADVGLMLYDSRRYSSRRSGVLGELLAAGVPVIVPAGCWLAEQIAEPNFRHVESVRRDLPCIRRHTTAQLSFGDSSSAAMIEAEVPERSDELAVRFSWRPPAGTYARVELKQLDKLGTEINRFAQIVGQRASGQPVELLFHLYQKTAAVKLVWRNAYDRTTTTALDIELSFHDAARLEQRQTPLGSIGLTAAERSYIPELLRDIQRHYVHYHCAAHDFSKPWIQSHDAQQTISQLVENSKRSQADRRERIAA